MPFDKVMSKFKSGDLHSGSKDGPRVKSHSQAVAILLAEKRKAQGGDQEYTSKDALSALRKASPQDEPADPQDAQDEVTSSPSGDHTSKHPFRNFGGKHAPPFKGKK